MSERKKYLDYAKGIGILLIVLAHCIQYFKPMGELNAYITSFHVPVFFVASGYLAFIKKDQQYKFTEFLKKRAMALLIPYVVFSLFNSALKIGVLLLKKSVTEDVIREEATALFITGNGTVWFLLTLFGIEMLYWCIKAVAKGNLVLYSLIAILLIVLPYVLNDMLGFPFGIVIIRIIAGLGFYLIGYVVRAVTINASRALNNTVCFMAVLIGNISYFVAGSDYSFFIGSFRNPFGSVPTSLFLSVGTVMLCEIIERCFDNKAVQFVGFFGKNSLIVMLIHPTILLFVTYPFGQIFWNMTGPVAMILPFVVFVLIVVSNIPFVFIINKWFPWAIGKKIKKEA